MKYCKETPKPVYGTIVYQEKCEYPYVTGTRVNGSVIYGPDWQPVKPKCKMEQIAIIK